MIDEAVQAVLQTTYGKLISVVLGAIISLLIALGVWVANRQIKRLDVHDVKLDKCTTDISGLTEAGKRQDMLASQMISDHKGDIIRLEGDMEDSESRTNKLIAANTENTNNYMSLVSEHFKDLISIMKKQGKDD